MWTAPCHVALDLSPLDHMTTRVLEPFQVADIRSVVVLVDRLPLGAVVHIHSDSGEVIITFGGESNILTDIFQGFDVIIIQS